MNIFVKTNDGYRKKVALKTPRGFNRAYKIRNLLGKMFHIGKWFFGIHLIAIKDKRIFSSPLYDGKINIGDIQIPSKVIPILFLRIKGENYRLHLALLGFSSKNLLNVPIHNPMLISYSINSKAKVYLPLRFNWFLYSLTKLQFIGPLWVNKEANRTAYMRTSVHGRYYYTVREINTTDYNYEKIKIFVGFLLASFSRPFVKRTIYLYEKKCDKYEESASVLFEGMLNRKIKNVRYILNNEKISDLVPNEYRSNVISRHTIKHYYHFFNAGLFIATEAPGHSIDLRIANFFAVNKLLKKKFKFVFLQHGITYMVSLGSQARKAFRHGSIYPDDVKIVVSSIEEAKHFIEEGGYSVDNLYITGLPKFDRLKWNEDAKNIVIMPTWRPWEYNEISQNCQASGYYTMITEILSSIPDELLCNVKILPHPLFLSSFGDTPLNDYVVQNQSYDEVLKNTVVLITDYSSISYDMFARGGKVIFWWKEKDYCMEQYKGELKLTEKKCFGDVVYSKEELSQSVMRAITCKQRSNKEIKNFREIVFDFNGRSTDKLIERLLEDGYIK